MRKYIQRIELDNENLYIVKEVEDTENGEIIKYYLVNEKDRVLVETESPNRIYGYLGELSREKLFKEIY